MKEYVTDYQGLGLGQLHDYKGVVGEVFLKEAGIMGQFCILIVVVITVERKEGVYVKLAKLE